MSMSFRRNLKAQSAIEYLMTYGWMLLVVAIVGGAIFSIAQSESVESVSGFSGSDVVVDDFGTTSEGELQLSMRNSAADSIQINSINVSNGEKYTEWKGGQDISVSETGLITLSNVTQGSSGANSLDITVNYDSGGLENLEASGTISGSFEISSDSAVNDNFGGESPMASFSTNITGGNGSVGEVIEFDASSSTEGSSSITNYEWSFNDTNTSAGETVTHNYNSEGNYTIELIVEDNNGLTDIATTEIEIIELTNNIVTEPSSNDRTHFDIDGFGTDFEITESSEPFIGEYMWESTDTNMGSSREKSLISMSGLENYIEQGDTFSYYTMEIISSNDNTGINTVFGAQDTNNWYGVLVRKGDPLKIVKDDAGSELATGSTDLVDGQWYEVEAEWGDDGTINATVWEVDSNGDRTAEIDSISATDTEYSSGGIGWSLGDTGGGIRHSSWTVN